MDIVGERAGARGLTQIRTSAEFFQQRPGFPHVLGLEALGEPAADRSEEIASLAAPTLIYPQSGEAGRGAQLQQGRFLLACDRQGLAEVRLGRGSPARRQVQRQDAPQAVEIGGESPVVAPSQPR
jgi:hypothetical protein